MEEYLRIQDERLKRGRGAHWRKNVNIVQIIEISESWNQPYVSTIHRTTEYTTKVTMISTYKRCIHNSSIIDPKICEILHTTLRPTIAFTVIYSSRRHQLYTGVPSQRRMDDEQTEKFYDHLNEDLRTKKTR